MLCRFFVGAALAGSGRAILRRGGSRAALLPHAERRGRLESRPYKAFLVAQALACVLFLLCALPAHAQYTPIPNATGTLAGQVVRNAINNKLSGADTSGISPVWVAIHFANLPASVQNGQVFYLIDGAPGTPCAGGGTGAIAQGINGIWACGLVPGGTAAPTSVSCSYATTVVGAGTIGAGATNYAGFFTTPNSSTDVDNCTLTFSIPSATNRMCRWNVRNTDRSANVAGAPDTSTMTTAKVDFPSAGSTSVGGVLTIEYVCF